jgi:hypothetical protein
MQELVKKNSNKKRKRYALAMKAAIGDATSLSVPDAARLVSTEAANLGHFSHEELTRQARRFAKAFSELHLARETTKLHGNNYLDEEQEEFLAGIFEGWSENGYRVDRAFMLSFANATFDINAKEAWY